MILLSSGTKKCTTKCCQAEGDFAEICNHWFQKNMIWNSFPLGPCYSCQSQLVNARNIIERSHTGWSISTEMGGWKFVSLKISFCWCCSNTYGDMLFHENLRKKIQNITETAESFQLTSLRLPESILRNNKHLWIKVNRLKRHFHRKPRNLVDSFSGQSRVAKFISLPSVGLSQFWFGV